MASPRSPRHAGVLTPLVAAAISLSALLMSGCKPAAPPAVHYLFR
jgi:hypothetical protein